MRKFLIFTSVFILMFTLFVGISSKAKAADQKEIDVWVYQSFYSNGEDSAIQKATNQFMELNPDIEVNIIPTVYGSGSYRDKFIRVARGGGGPDVIMTDIIWVPQLAAMDLLKPVGNYLGEKRNEFFQTPLNAATYEENLYGVPFHTNALGYYYNKDLFKKAGLDPEDPPQTWAEFKAAANLITKETNSHGFGYMGHWGGSFEWFSPFWAFGARVINEDHSKASVNSAQGLQATQFWFDMVEDDGVVPKAASTWKSWEEIASGFATETAGMVFGFPNLLLKIDQKDVDFEWGVAKLPEGRDGRASILGGGHLCINKNSENPEIAYKWIDFVTDKEQLWVFDRNQRTSARKDAIKYQEFLRKDPKMKPLFESLEFARPRPPIPKWTQIDYDTIQPQFSKVLHEDKSIKKALDDAANGINEILQK